MADGIHCKHCGWYEGYHDDGSGADDEWDIPKKGYKLSLKDCSRGHGPGFTPDDPELARKLMEKNLHEIITLNENWGGGD